MTVCEFGSNSIAVLPRGFPFSAALALLTFHLSAPPVHAFSNALPRAQLQRASVQRSRANGACRWMPDTAHVHMMAAKRVVKRKGGAPATKPSVQVNTKYRGLKQIHQDPAIFTIDNFFDRDTCERYKSLGMTGEANGDALKVDSATFGGAWTARNRQSTTWFLKYSSAQELVKSALELLPDRSLKNCEEPQIVRYEMGDFFNWHQDALPPEVFAPFSRHTGCKPMSVLIPGLHTCLCLYSCLNLPRHLSPGLSVRKSMQPSIIHPYVHSPLAHSFDDD